VENVNPPPNPLFLALVTERSRSERERAGDIEENYPVRYVNQ
jgi:hypothetical protein